MICLITGGSGFIGAYTTRTLLEHDSKVITYDLAPDKNSILEILSPEELKQIQMIQGDIDDTQHLFRIIRENQIDTIIHLVALLADASRANPTQAIQVNCIGLNHVFEAARIFHIRRVVWASSAGALGSPQMYDQEWIPDDALLYPRSIYGACKALNEFMAHHYFNQMGVDNIGLRFPIVYGKGRLRGTGAFASELLESVALGKSYTIPYTSETHINWQYVEDTARCILLACLVDRTETRVFNTSGDLRTVGEAIECIKRMLPETKLSYGKEVIGFAQKYDKENIKRQLGYEPEYPIEKGFKKTINEFRAKAELQIVL